MNRWKREQIYTLILMHGHHSWSQYNGCILMACERLGLPIGTYARLNHSGDGSYDRHWYTSAAALERVGGEQEVRRLAREIQENSR